MNLKYHRTVGAMPKLYSLNHLLDRFEVETEYKVELPQALQRCLEVLQKFLWILLSKVYGLTMTISTVCVYKKKFQLLQKVLKVHSTY